MTGRAEEGRPSRPPASDVETPASPLQRQRAVVLVAIMIVATSTGIALRANDAPLRARAPAPCAAPALDALVLRCDGHGAPPGARAWLAGHKLDVNRATAAELERIPGVGPSLASSIVQTRDAHGPFANVAALDNVPGIGPKTVAKLRAFIDVAERGAAPSSAADRPARLDGRAPH